MPSIRFIADGDGAWPDLVVKAAENKVLHFTEPFQVAYLARGTQAGNPSLMMRFDLADGKVLLVETTVALFEGVAAAVRGRKERGNGRA